MNDSGFEEDQVQLLADLTSQALLHQPASADGDPLESLERLVAAAAASSEVPPSSAAYLYGFTLCIGETLRYLTEQERLPADHPVVQGICQHMLSEYSRLVQHVCSTGKQAGPADGGAPYGDGGAPYGDGGAPYGDGGAAGGDDDEGSGEELAEGAERGQDGNREREDESGGSGVFGGVELRQLAPALSPEPAPGPEDGPQAAQAVSDV